MRPFSSTQGPLAAIAKIMVIWGLWQQTQLGVGALPALSEDANGPALSHETSPTTPIQTLPGVPESSQKEVVKRSTDEQGRYLPYNSLLGWPKRNDGDQGFDSYMQSIAYDPYSGWGKRNSYESYMQGIGYDPYTAWAKRPVGKGKAEYHYENLGKGTEVEHGGNGGDEIGVYYQQPTLQYYDADKVKRPDSYSDVYIPNHLTRSYKRSINPYYFSLASNDWKRAPNDMGAQGFHEGIFTHNFGDFSPVKRGKREVQEKDHEEPEKRRMGMGGASGFHGDTFSQGFGDFDTMKKRRMGMGGASGFHGDTFSQGFGDFDTMKKRRMGMGASGFHGDTFSQGFGDFDTMKKRRMGMGGASGFHGDTFSQGFGDFDTMKKRRMGMGASGFHGDTFSQGFGDFDTMKKRRMGMGGASGFHGDTFSQGFGDFDTMKKRRLGMGASGFHGDTFNQGFGDFDTMKKRHDTNIGGSSYTEEGKQTTLEGKQERERSVETEGGTGGRKKRGTSDENDRVSDSYDETKAVYDEKFLLRNDDEEESDEEEEEDRENDDRPKRNLERDGLLEIEFRPPVEVPASDRSKRSVEDRTGDHHSTSDSKEDASPLYKRSVNWISSGGLGEFSTMKRRR